MSLSLSIPKPKQAKLTISPKHNLLAADWILKIVHKNAQRPSGRDTLPVTARLTVCY
jgi:hypothetical protein